MIPVQPVQVTSSPVSRCDSCRDICRRCVFEAPWVTRCHGWLGGWCGVVRKSRKIRTRGFWCPGSAKSEAILSDLFIQHTLSPTHQFSSHQTHRTECSLSSCSHFPFAACGPVQKNDFTKGSPTRFKNIPDMNVIKVFVLLEGIAMEIRPDWEGAGTLLRKSEWNSTLEHEELWARRGGFYTETMDLHEREEGPLLSNNPNPSVWHLQRLHGLETQKSQDCSEMWPNI